MNLVKKIILLVWPVIYEKLQELVEDTETQFDDVALEAANTAIQEFCKNE